ncbi:hypothetical protein VNI00_015559 [Paramarasmius palmivorus]|uniref:SWIM-type domain-containing protein n=1 Tax=Paramarasmius palmivorus TaxID=297713 RepID=A0AAW0BJW9_9AGAR
MPGPRNSPAKNASLQRKTRSRTPRNVWINLTASEASGEKDGGLSARRLASDVYIDQLVLTPDQQQRISSLYNQNSIMDYQFSARNDSDQSQAAVVLGIHDLHVGRSSDFRSRWGMCWNDSGKEGRGGKGKNTENEATRRVLYQCHCGYNEKVAGSKKRNSFLPFTGCTAHAEITYKVKSEKILRIRGYFEHNDACKNASILHYPAVPLHTDVFDVALDQLKAGCSLTDIQEHNQRMHDSNSYPSLVVDPSLKSRFRYLLKAYDTRSLYRQFNRLQGIKVSEPAHLNIHAWLDPSSPQYNKTLHEAIFYYQARQEKGDRFKACVATPEMKEASWKYAHNSQIILDGTFGICDRKILLFIIMGIDEERKGVPLAFLFFSAPSQNRHTAGGYSREILVELLNQWKVWLGERDGETFDVLVAITDTDLKERGALLVVFPGIWLLICKFHLRQSWRNQRNKVLKGNSPLHILLKQRLKLLEDSLIATTLLQEAKQLIERETRAVMGMKDQDPDNATLYDTALKYLQDYLLGYWTTDALWSSWSQFGRIFASRQLKCDCEGVLPTTNHLESFNGVLKRKHLQRWQRGGRRLRLDVLLMLLVTKILPAIFYQRRLTREDTVWWDTIIEKLPGGKELVERRKQDKKKGTTPIPTVAYLTADTERDAAARRLLESHQISTPEIDSQGTSLTFRCYSSISVANEANPMMYTVWLAFDGRGSCTCQDWLSRGGACKHLRAALIKTDELRQLFPTLPCISLPESLTAAQVLHGELERAQLVAGAAAPLSMSTMARNVIQNTASGVDEALEMISEDVYATTQGSNDEPDSPEPDSDTESVATDAPDLELVREADFDVQQFDVVSATQNALNSQALSRTFHDFELALPKLAEWTEYLQYATHIPTEKDLVRAKQYNDQILALSTQLQRLMLSSTPKNSDSGIQFTNESQEEKLTDTLGLSTQAQDTKGGEKVTAENQPLTWKRHAAAPAVNVIAVSPEKKQKRQKSYGSH